MDDILYELRLDTKGPHSIDIRMESDDLNLDGWNSIIQGAIDDDDFVQFYCMRSKSWHIFKGKDIIHYAIKQLSRQELAEKAKKIKNMRLF